MPWLVADRAARGGGPVRRHGRADHRGRLREHIPPWTAGAYLFRWSRL